MLATAAAATLLSRPVLPAKANLVWPRIELVQVADTLAQVTHLESPRDGSGRLFIVSRGGRVRILQNGVMLPGLFLDISGRVRTTGNEEGLLSMAFPPGYPDKGYFYAYYTDVNGDNVVARFYLTADPNIADPASEEQILTIAHPLRQNHNGGQLAFSPQDGYLYIGIGDGGAGQSQNAQDTATLLGKILRIDVESAAAPYGVPADNPFSGVAGYREEIWATGLRNPWRFSFDRLTGDLYIGDVGQLDYEEIDVQPASSPGGENYGWDILEGDHCYSPPTGCVMPPGYSPPAVEYDHTVGRSVTGGKVYRGPAAPFAQGVYLYADFVEGTIWGLQRDGEGWRNVLLLDTDLRVSTFGEDGQGEVYLADYAAGTVHRVVFSGPLPPKYHNVPGIACQAFNNNQANLLQRNHVRIYNPPASDRFIWVICPIQRVEEDVRSTTGYPNGYINLYFNEGADPGSSVDCVLREYTNSTTAFPAPSPPYNLATVHLATPLVLPATRTAPFSFSREDANPPTRPYYYFTVTCRLAPGTGLNSIDVNQQ